VLVVDRLAFDACNASEPLAAFADGATRFRLDRPGFFCFISGEAGHCEDGQRLIVRVMVHPALAAAPGPAASAPVAPTLPGHGGGGGGRPRPSGCSCSDASSGVGTAVAAAAGVSIAAAMATVVGLVLMLQ
jgi:hypothetical protein